MRILPKFIIIFTLVLNLVAKVNANTKTIIITRVNNQNSAINGSVIDVSTVDGHKVGTYETSLNGSVIINNLDDNVYIIREIQSADGETISPDIATVDFTTDKKSIERVVLTSTPASSVIKIQAKNVLNNEFVENLSLALYDAGQEVGTYKTNSNGEITIDKLRNSKYFYLINNEKLNGYEKLEAPITVEFKNNTFNQVLYVEPVKLKIKLNNFIIGKEYGFFKADKKGQSKELFKVKITSKETFTDYLTSGDYKIQEYPYNTSEGYIFNLDDSNDIFNINFAEYKAKNTLKENITLGISNKTVKEALALSSIKHTIRNISVKSDVTLERLYINISIPNGLLLERFFTGRYSQHKKFNIYYKLKGINEYYSVIKDVPTNLVQEINLETIKKNGIVTDLLLEFLNVNNGFYDIESPFTYTYVTNIKNDYKMDCNVVIYTSYLERIYKQTSTSKVNIFNIQ